MGSEVNPTQASFAQPSLGSIERSPDAARRTQENTFSSIFNSLKNNRNITDSSVSSSRAASRQATHHDSPSIETGNAVAARHESSHRARTESAARASERRNIDDRQDVASSSPSSRQENAEIDQKADEGLAADRTVSTANSYDDLDSSVLQEGPEHGVDDHVALTDPTNQDAKTTALAPMGLDTNTLDSSTSATAISNLEVSTLSAAAGLERPELSDISKPTNTIVPKAEQDNRLSLANPVPTSGIVGAINAGLVSPLGGLDSASASIAEGQGAQLGSSSISLQRNATNATATLTQVTAHGSSESELVISTRASVPAIDTQLDFAGKLNPEAQMGLDLAAKLVENASPLSHSGIKPSDASLALDQRSPLESSPQPLSVLAGLLNGGILKHREFALVNGAIPTKPISGADSVEELNPAALARATAERLSAPSSPSTTVRLASQNLVTSSQWPMEVNEHMRMLVGRGIQSAELQLNPQSLGMLQVRVETVDDQARVSFNVQSALAKEQIEAQLPRLRDIFMSGSVELMDVDVRTGGGDSQEHGPSSDEQLSTNDRSINEHVASSTLDDLDTLWLESGLGSALLDTFA